jgi:hypothetical protein
MRRFQLADHPHELALTAEYGFDPFCGFFVEVVLESRDQPLAVYDALQTGYDHHRPLLGALDFLVSQRFFTQKEIESALDAYAGHEDEPQLSKRARSAFRVIENFKRAAD